MKLVIGKTTEENPEPEVNMWLRENGGGEVALEVKKKGYNSQTILTFNPNGKVKRIKTFTDIGFNVGSDGRVVTE